MPTCEQCGDTTTELTPSEYGPLCSVCAYRQAEHDQYGYGLSASMFGFIDETE